MPELHSVALFVVAGLALNLTPGPDMLYIAARGASEGRAAGVVSALGVTAGTLVHIALVAGGLAALLAAVPVAYAAVRLAGAAYLVALGLRALMRPSGLVGRALGGGRPRVAASRWAVFRQGVITNVLNPKVALFCLAFLPQFVDPSRGRPAVQVLALGLLFNTTSTLVNLAVALGASRAAARLRQSARAARLLERATGALFVGLGVRLAVGGRR
ncbi:MAG: LysE family translocator [Gemmatimonadaceae bacterium]